MGIFVSLKRHHIPRKKFPANFLILSIMYRNENIDLHNLFLWLHVKSMQPGQRLGYVSENLLYIWRANYSKLISKVNHVRYLFQHLLWGLYIKFTQHLYNSSGLSHQRKFINKLLDFSYLFTNTHKLPHTILFVT